MSNTIENYGVKDIKTLDGIEAIRLRPGMEEYNRLFNFCCLQRKKKHS